METNTPITQDQRFKKLRRFNLIMALLHFTQGILMLVLSSNFALPVTTAFLQYDLQSQRLSPFLNEVFNLRLGYVIAAFLLISALAHLAVSLPKINGWYANNLKKGANYARWIEYFFSSSLMIVAVSMLVGIYDLVSLLAIFFLNGCMILFGWLMEKHNQSTSKTDWTSFYFGSLAGAIPWVAVAIYLFGSGSDGAKAPTFVYWIFFSIFLFFNCFALNMVLQYKKAGKWKDYLYGERAYIILSLVAKSLLAWQVWAGTLRPV